MDVCFLQVTLVPLTGLILSFRHILSSLAFPIVLDINNLNMFTIRVSVCVSECVYCDVYEGRFHCIVAE